MIPAVSAATVQPDHRRLLWSSLCLGAGLSLAVCCAVAVQAVVVGSAEGRWFYPHGQRATVGLIAVWILYSAAAAFIVSVPWKSIEPRRWWILIAWIVIATGLQWGLRSTARYPLEALFVSDTANSFYSVTREHGSVEILSQFNRVRTNAPLHVQSNMPGKLLLIEGLQRISTRTDVLPWLVIGLSNLGAILMYGFVRELFDSRRTAMYAAALYLFLPARTFFFPLMNTITPLAALACGWLLLRWLRTGRTAYALLLGMALYGLVLFEPLPLVMGLLFLMLVMSAIFRGQIAWDRFIAQAAVVIFAFIGASEAVTAWSGFDIVRTFQTIGDHAREFNETAERPYRIWITANLWEFAFGMGLCQAVAIVVALAFGLRAPGNWRQRLSRPIVAVCVGSLAVLLAVDLIGVNRGEVTRLWIFLACFFQIPAAYLCSTLNARSAIALVIGVTAFQAAVGLTLIDFVVP